MDNEENNSASPRRTMTHMEAHKVIGWLKKNKSVYFSQKIETSVATARTETGVTHLSTWGLGALARELGYQKASSPGESGRGAVSRRLEAIEANIAFIAKELGVTLPEVSP